MGGAVVTLARRRLVIEALLCFTDWHVIGFSWMGTTFTESVIESADRLVMEAASGSIHLDIEHDACEAAYRLIESSPTLRREWFGKAVKP